MMNDLDNLIPLLAIYALPVILAITLHEAAHAQAAWLLGDPTARQLGRVSANPLRHIDPFGTLLLPALMLWLGGMLFGWAKPVPVRFDLLHHPRRDMLWVAAAGPAANLIMALGWGLLLKAALLLPPDFVFAQAAQEMSRSGIVINSALLLLNLLPLPPLDGGRITLSLLPPHIAQVYARIEPFGLWILIALLVSGLLGSLLHGLVGGFLLGLQRLLGL